MGPSDMESGFSVLVVDDEPDAADSAAQVLALHGFAARAVNDGEAALAAVAAAPPDVVLIDLMMPRMDGYELARRLRQECAPKRPLLVAVTGCGTPDDCERSVAAGLDLHLVKPVDPGVLVGVVRRFHRVVASPCQPVGGGDRVSQQAATA